MKNLRNSVFQCLFVAVMAGALAISATGRAAPVKPGQKPPETIDALMVGDRLIDVAYHLGVVPRAMSFRCDVWAFGRTMATTASRFVGCPHYIVKKNPRMVPETLRKMKIKRVLIERSPLFDPGKPSRDPMNLLPVLEQSGVMEELGVVVEVVDFGTGVEEAILQLGKLLGREAKAAALIEHRRAVQAEAERLLPLPIAGKRVVILEGVYQPGTGKAFVRVELPGGVSDRFLLEPLGLVNAGNGLAGGEGANGRFRMIRSLASLIPTNPDVLVMTGDADAVQRLLVHETRRNQGLGTVNALVSGAVFTLPAYKDSSVTDYPQILKRWAAALAGL